MPFDRILQKSFGTLVLLGAGVSAFLSALGVVRIAQAAVLPNAALLAAAPVLATPTVASSPRNASADAIAARNPFDSEAGALAKSVSANAPDATNAPTCDDAKVTIIAQAADPSWSFAAIHDTKNPVGQLRRRGDDFGGKHVEFVSWDRVWLSSNGVFCQIPLAADTDEKPAPVASEQAALDPEIAKGIRRVSAKEYEIDRGTLDRVLADSSRLEKIRVVPEQEKGKTVGVRLYGIKRDSVLAAIGIQDGDRLDSVNGLDIATPDTALAAYAQLKTATHLTLKINRKGNPTQLDYDIH